MDHPFTSQRRYHAAAKSLLPRDIGRLLSGIDIDRLENDLGRETYMDADRCYLLMHAHCLPSFVVLIECLISAFGFPPENIFIVSKHYSTMPDEEVRLRELGVTVVSAAGRYRIGCYDDAQCAVLSHACELLRDRYFSSRSDRGRVIVVDDGGLISTMWSSVNESPRLETISIQHTASGIGRKGEAAFRINVAQSAAKRIFEARIIAQSVIRKLDHLKLPIDAARIGIVGYGAIGRALANSLIAKGHMPFVLEHPKTPIRIPSQTLFDPDIFINKADVIFGCSGVNWSSNIHSTHSIDNKLFISCSSRDVEFKYLLEHFSSGEIVTEIKDVDLVQFKKSKVLNGGFPINFDRKYEWETFAEIGLTRYLILSAIIFSQYLDTSSARGDTLMLPVTLQQSMVREWLAAADYSADRFGVRQAQMDSERWWQSNSAGVEYRA